MIWVVYREVNDEGEDPVEILGVFSSIEKAQSALTNKIKSWYESYITMYNQGNEYYDKRRAVVKRLKLSEKDVQELGIYLNPASPLSLAEYLQSYRSEYDIRGFELDAQ